MRDIIVSSAIDPAQLKQIIVVEVYGEPMSLEGFLEAFDRSVDTVGVESYTGHDLKGGSDETDEETGGDGQDTGHVPTTQGEGARDDHGHSAEPPQPLQVRAAPVQEGVRSSSPSDGQGDDGSDDQWRDSAPRE